MIQALVQSSLFLPCLEDSTTQGLTCVLWIMEWISSISGFPDGGSLRPPVALVSGQGRCQTVPRVQAVCAVNTISAQPWISGASSSC